MSLPLLPDSELGSRVSDDEAGFGALTTPQGVLPLRALKVHARIDGLAVRTDVVQTFVNAFSMPLEATYIFPLPDRAAVTSFKMQVAGRIVEGTLKERGEARRDYDRAIKAGQRASIAEEERSGVFTLRVGNLMPGEEAVIHLTLSGPLPCEQGEATFRFPLVVAPRYIPGTPLPGPSVGDGTESDTDAVPDASRITPPVLLPGYPHPVQLALRVDLASGGLPIHDLRSSLHAVSTVEKDGLQRIEVQPGERLNRDFLLRFRVGNEAVRTSFVLQPDAEGDEGTFLLTVVPPTTTPASRPRDIAFVLDRSGSMQGWKIVAARRALSRMVDTLTDEDRFTVIAFDNARETPPAFNGPALVPATNRNRFRAVEYLATVDGRGGTEIAPALECAVDQLASRQPNRDRLLVLVTDGQVGNEDQVLRSLAQKLKGVRVFALGIDQAVNLAFLNRLADLGGGTADQVESEDRLDEVMDRVHRRLGTPVLTDLALKPQGLEVNSASIVPSRIPDLHAGTPVTILGRYIGPKTGSVTVSAHESGRPWTETVSATLTEGGAMPALWARRYVRELEDRYASGQGKPDRHTLMDRIVRTSLRFGVLCRFTAFVAVDVQEVVNPDGTVHRVTQPVEPAAGWDMLGTGEAEDQGAMYAMAPSAARGGMSGAMGIAGLSDTESVDSYLMEFEGSRTYEKLARSAPPSPPSPPTPPRRKAADRPLAHSARVQLAIQHAFQEAFLRSAGEVTPEDLLLGLLRLLDVKEALELVGITADAASIRQAVLDRLRALPAAPASNSVTTRVEECRYSDEARRVLHFAQEAAQDEPDGKINPEHVLRGLLSLGTGVAAEILEGLQKKRSESFWM